MKYFITGGSGGLGRELVRGLVGAGHSVAFTYHKNEDAAATLVGDLSAASGQCSAHMLDVTDADGVDGVVRSVLGMMGGVDMVVNNAGIHAPKPAAWLSTKDWTRVIETNLNGAFFVARAFIEPFMAAGHGRFVHIGSVAAKGMTGDIAYAASKAGLEGLSATLAREYGKYGITSNVLMAGLADTGTY
ncbi:MAG: SDR family NAD(P)-dependent oxidoreductase, partial [Magnetovibrio sp.]|nr:SDR family NAD(P)-dependent oxidoreductase [Magnetovibrio sp.]